MAFIVLPLIHICKVDFFFSPVLLIQCAENLAKNNTTHDFSKTKSGTTALF